MFLKVQHAQLIKVAAKTLSFNQLLLNHYLQMTQQFSHMIFQKSILDILHLHLIKQNNLKLFLHLQFSNWKMALFSVQQWFTTNQISIHYCKYRIKQRLWFCCTFQKSIQRFNYCNQIGNRRTQQRSFQIIKQQK
ncbi:unnamed protein product [Paramecium sonneborni]|uniref:Uncharacterized protein n=1 Tax=Paramecium sonneborni TaxID=65129 RepID=A0A8S1KVU2_9CILI|nr:unnamed protein product [Paramecium sonneborni]